MKRRLKTNTGTLITVTHLTYHELSDAHKNGVWCAIVRDINGSQHMVIIPDNF